MSPDQEAEFEGDIAERGIRVPIEIIDGRIIVDGRSRYLAAKRLGFKRVPVIPAPLNGDHPVIYMLRAATKRRHLTDDQRACLAREEMEILSQLAKTERARLGGLAGGRGRPKATDSLPITLAQKQPGKTASRTSVAVTYRVSERKVRAAHRLKQLSERLYEQVRSGQQRLAVAHREADREARRREQQRLSRSARLHADDSNWEIRCGDCIQELATIKPGTVRLIFCDPPYNQGVNYGRGERADSLPDKEYLDWCRKWIASCVRVLTDDGSLWVMISDEYADHLGLLLRQAGLHRRSWIKWYETFGVNCTNNFNRSSRHIFYCVKNPRRFVFNPEAVSRPSDRQSKYGDARANPHGKLWDNVWCIPRLVENSHERLPDFPTQLPLALVRPIVLCASQPGDLVVDPFSGSGTTGVAAVEAGRRFIGVERNQRFAVQARRRIASLSS
jgi:site-specific DNA-methyltransferase (adenine-specific)